MTKSLHLIPILICVKVCLRAADKDCRAVIKPLLPVGSTQRFMLFTNNYVLLRLQEHIRTRDTMYVDVRNELHGTQRRLIC